MARELGFHSGRHADLEYVAKDTFIWKDFILKEEFIRYEDCRLLRDLHVANALTSGLLLI